MIQPATDVLTPGPDDQSCKRPSFSDVVKHQPSTANNATQIPPPDVSHTSLTLKRYTTNIDAARTRCNETTTHVARDNQTREDTVHIDCHINDNQMSEDTAHIDNHINESKASANKFTAVKRKRNVSYFVENINSKATEKDIS